MEPFFHWDGSAGRMRIFPLWLCMSISSIPETEVTVNLERWVGIEKVVVSLVRSEEHADHLVSVIAIVHAGPEIDFPGERPTGSIVATLFQRNGRALD